MTENNSNNTKKIIQEIISTQTGLELDQITVDAAWSELGIDMIDTFPRIVALINQSLKEELPLQDPDFIQEIKQTETVGDFIDIVNTELEF